MTDFTKVTASLTRRGFAVSSFATAGEAADYLDKTLDGRSIGIGGSVTIRDMGLAQRLGTHNQVLWHWLDGTLPDAAAASVYLTSCNALAETGEILNIDGTGNRVASTLFGHEEVYFLVGCNKLCPDYDAALWRARNVAAPKNAMRLKKKTPCALRGDRCYDCSSPQRICRALNVLWAPPGGVGRTEVVLIDEPLGF